MNTVLNIPLLLHSSSFANLLTRAYKQTRVTHYYQQQLLISIPIIHRHTHMNYQGNPNQPQPYPNTNTNTNSQALDPLPPYLQASSYFTNGPQSADRFPIPTQNMGYPNQQPYTPTGEINPNSHPQFNPYPFINPYGNASNPNQYPPAYTPYPIPNNHDAYAAQSITPAPMHTHTPLPPPIPPLVYAPTPTPDNQIQIQPRPKQHKQHKQCGCVWKCLCKPICQTLPCFSCCPTSIQKFIAYTMLFIIVCIFLWVLDQLYLYYQCQEGLKNLDNHANHYNIPGFAYASQPYKCRLF